MSSNLYKRIRKNVKTTNSNVTNLYVVSLSNFPQPEIYSGNDIPEPLTPEQNIINNIFINQQNEYREIIKDNLSEREYCIPITETQGGGFPSGLGGVGNISIPILWSYISGLENIVYDNYQSTPTVTTPTPAPEPNINYENWSLDITIKSSDLSITDYSVDLLGNNSENIISIDFDQVDFLPNEYYDLPIASRPVGGNSASIINSDAQNFFFFTAGPSQDLEETAFDMSRRNIFSIVNNILDGDPCWFINNKGKIERKINNLSYCSYEDPPVLTKLWNIFSLFGPEGDGWNTGSNTVAGKRVNGWNSINKSRVSRSKRRTLFLEKEKARRAAFRARQAARRAAFLSRRKKLQTDLDTIKNLV